MSTLEIEVWSGRLLVGRTALDAGRSGIQMSVGTRGQLPVQGAGILPVHLWLGAHRGALYASSTDESQPARVRGQPVPTGWTQLSVPCELAFGSAVARVRVAEPAREAAPSPPSGATRVHAVEGPPPRKASAEPPAAAAPPDKPAVASSHHDIRGAGRTWFGNIPRPVRLVIASGTSFLLALTCWAVLRGGGAPPHASVPPARPRHVRPGASVDAPPRQPAPEPTVARATAAPTEPDASLGFAADGRDIAGERRIAEAMFAGDFARATSDAEALATAHPEAADYAVMVRVFRAKLRRKGR